MIEELEKTESTWSRIPTAGRNRALLQKWKKELKVSTIGRSRYTRGQNVTHPISKALQ